MNDIKMSSKNFFDVNMTVEDVKSETKQKDVFTFNIKIDKEHLEGYTYADLLGVLFEHLKSRIILAPNKKTCYEAGAYAVDINLPIEEVIVDGDTMCLIVQGNPFTRKIAPYTKHLLPFYADIVVEEDGTNYGPEEE